MEHIEAGKGEDSSVALSSCSTEKEMCLQVDLASHLWQPGKFHALCWAGKALERQHAEQP